MKLNTYRDGGTIAITDLIIPADITDRYPLLNHTHRDELCIDGRIGSTTNGHLFILYPENGVDVSSDKRLVEWLNKRLFEYLKYNTATTIKAIENLTDLNKEE